MFLHAATRARQLISSFLMRREDELPALRDLGIARSSLMIF
jgi:hypothetical protein